MLSFLNFFILHSVYIGIYFYFFPEERGSVNVIAPGLWFFVSWWYMKDPTKNSNKASMKSKRNNTPLPNTVGDLEQKFSTSFLNTDRESFTRDSIKYALFVFRIDQQNLTFGQYTAVVVVNMQTTGYRYFVVEKSAVGNSFLLCEWIFDKKNKKIKHLNYGGVATSMYKSSNEVITGNEVLIMQIDTIVKMKIEPEMTSIKTKFGWSSTAKKVDERIEKLANEMLEKIKKK